MIRRRVSAVIQLHDGFLGRPLECTLPQYRIDGANQQITLHFSR